MKRLGIAVVAIAAVVGLKYYNKGAAHDEVKEHLVKLCEADARCEKAVATHFDTCFEESFKMGGRRQASRLEADKLVSCLNRRSGTPYFATAEEE